MSTKVGRNDKCPCGSGKKYKQCCLRKDEDAARAQAPRQAAAEEVIVGGHWVDGGDIDELEEVSNGIVDLVERRRFDEAEAACRRLQRDWPDLIDGIERMGLIREAQGRNAEAAQFYAKAAEFAATHEGFDREAITWFREKAKKLATMPSSSSPPVG